MPPKMTVKNEFNPSLVTIVASQCFPYGKHAKNVHAIAAKFDPISIIDLWRKPIRPIKVKFQVARRSRSATATCTLAFLPLLVTRN